MRFRKSISHKVFRVLADYSWQILVVAGIGSFALGCVGYWTYLSSQHKGPSFGDVAYASMQLFFGTTMAETHLPTRMTNPTGDQPRDQRRLGSIWLPQ